MERLYDIMMWYIPGAHQGEEEKLGRRVGRRMDGWRDGEREGEAGKTC